MKNKIILIICSLLFIVGICFLIEYMMNPNSNAVKSIAHQEEYKN